MLIKTKLGYYLVSDTQCYKLSLEEKKIYNWYKNKIHTQDSYHLDTPVNTTKGKVFMTKQQLRDRKTREQQYYEFSKEFTKRNTKKVLTREDKVNKLHKKYGSY